MRVFLITVQGQYTQVDVLIVAVVSSCQMIRAFSSEPYLTKPNPTRERWRVLFRVGYALHAACISLVP